jgi:hypothetical protein
MTSNNRNRNNRNRSGNPAVAAAAAVHAPVQNAGPKPLTVSANASLLETETIFQKRATERFKNAMNDPAFREDIMDIYANGVEDISAIEQIRILKLLTDTGLAEDKPAAYEHYKGAAADMDAMLHRALDKVVTGK